MNNFHNLRLPIGKFLENEIIKFLQSINYFSKSTDNLKKYLESIPSDYLSNDSAKNSNPLLMIRYFPDLLAINKNKINETFLLDTKVMFTPVYLDTFLNKINQHLTNKINLEDIGLIEREAYQSYVNHHKAGSKVVVLVACSYNPKFLFCDYVENLKILYTEKQSKNYFSSGSKTPRVNIDLRKMKTFKKFFSELSQNNIDDICDNFHSNLRKKINFIGLPSKIYKERAEKIRGYLNKKCNMNLSFKNLD